MWESVCVGGFALGAAGLARRPVRASGWAWRNRMVTAGIVAACLGVFALAMPERHARDQAQYLFVITLGYGHLLGAAFFARRRVAALRPVGVPAPLFRAFLAVTTANAFALHAWGGRAHAAAFLPLLAISVWHIAENDLGLARAYRNRLQLGPVSRGRAEPFGSTGITFLILALALATLGPEGVGALGAGTALGQVGGRACRIAAGACGLLLVRRGGTSVRLLGAGVILVAVLIPGSIPATSGVGFGDVFSGVTLYHLVSWLMFFADRARAAGGEESARLVQRLFWIHVPPVAVCAGLLAWPGSGAGLLQQALFSPAIYLFWSVLHVAQTALVRGASGGASDSGRRPGPVPKWPV